jgi:hypothetical protein
VRIQAVVEGAHDRTALRRTVRASRCGLYLCRTQSRTACRPAGHVKNELVCGQVFRTMEEARSAIFNYIEVFYNRQPIHQTLGYVAPEEFEMKVVV